MEKTPAFLSCIYDHYGNLVRQIRRIKSVIRHFDLSSSTALSDRHSYERILIKEIRSASQKSQVGTEKDKSYDKQL